MKIEIAKIPPEGYLLEEDFQAQSLELETEVIKLDGPIKAKAQVSKITNAITVKLSLSGCLRMSCSRCLREFQDKLDKKFTLNFPIDKLETKIDLDPEIRDQIILDYPINPLCRQDCKGLCPKCGIDLNQVQCNCG
jgi:uncharacterized protein